MNQPINQIGCTSEELRTLSAELVASRGSASRWRLIAVGTIACAGGIVLGGMQQVSTRKLQAIVLDPSRSSGRWNSTLLAVDESGKVYSLNTSKPQTVWEAFMYSP